MLSLFETIVVLYLAYHEEELLLPRWLVSLVRQVCGVPPPPPDDNECCAGIVCRTALQEHGRAPFDWLAGSSAPPSLSPVQDASESQGLPEGGIGRATAAREGAKVGVDKLMKRIRMAQGSEQIEVAARLCFFERLFFTLDVKCQGWLSVDNVRAMRVQCAHRPARALQETNLSRLTSARMRPHSHIHPRGWGRSHLHHRPQTPRSPPPPHPNVTRGPRAWSQPLSQIVWSRLHARNRWQVARLLSFILITKTHEACTTLVQMGDDNGNGQVVRLEFVQLMAETLWDTPLDYIEKASTNFLDAESMLAKRHKAHWDRMSKQVDRYSRVVMPLAFTLALCVLFAIDFSDECEYARDPTCRDAACNTS